MSRETLINGYRRILTHIYAPRQYYARIGVLLRDHRPRLHKRPRIRAVEIRAFLKSMWYIGIREKGQRYYWQLLGSTILRRPRSLPLAVRMAIYGYHFRKLVEAYARGPATAVQTMDTTPR
ncbi:MAG: DUF4070 domain-containing protein [Chloroflexi bacterium]|nr:DUF4070 domain-containing protein [Chloroflexota bacterium]